MATLRYTGNAPSVAQVDTLTVGGTIEAGDLFKVTINGKTLSVAAESADANAVRDAIVTAWGALSAGEYPEFAEVTCAAGAGTGELTLTAKTAGRPFTIGVETTESDGSAADGQTFARAETTANSGPNVWGAGANWDTGTAPVDGDDVVVEGQNTPDILYDLDQSAVTLASLTIDASYRGRIGLPARTSGNNTYAEYRETALKISATRVTIGQGDSSAGGSQRIKLDLGENATTVNVVSTASQGDESGYPPVELQGSHANNVLRVTRGNVGVALRAGQTAQFPDVSVAGQNARVRCGAGVVLSAVAVSAGTLTTESDIAMAEVFGGELVHLSGTVGTLNIDGGAVRYRSDGTIATVSVGGGGALDFREPLQSRTVTNAKLYERAALYDPFGLVTWTNGIDFERCTPANVTLEVAPHQNWTPSSIA